MNGEPTRTPEVIAIDGPAASGKSTIGYMLAEHLNFLYLDTGSMYRASTLAALRSGIDPEDEDAVTAIASKLDLKIMPYAGESDGRQYTVLLDDHDVTWELRSPAVDAHVSAVSSYARVRQEMVRRQREIAKQGAVVMVGRDIGTVVVPDAPLKLYITASHEERARRRWLDRKSQGHDADYAKILADVDRRDQIDSNRKHSPLRPADDAMIIDNTDQTPKSVLTVILDLLYANSPDRQKEIEGN